MSECPGCGLRVPRSAAAEYTGSYNASPECWAAYTEVLAAEYGNAVLFGQVHQLSVDAYAVQHAGGAHPDKSVGIHLCGLCLVLERRVRPPQTPRLLQRLASEVERWPHLAPPPSIRSITVQDVARAPSPSEHIRRARAWAATVWAAWSEHHAAIATLLDRCRIGGRGSFDG